MASSIKSVSYYTATEITCCDRCGQVIKHIAHVTYRDGEVQRYGWDCIEKILENAPDLKGLFKKNLKLAGKYRDYINILSGPVEKMPRGQEYFNSGKYFIADSEGKDIFFPTHWFFHPAMDVEKNHSGNAYVSKDPVEFAARCNKEIANDLPKLQAELNRIEGFLARVLAKASAVAGVVA